jgi:hypothetical protein
MSATGQWISVPVTPGEKRLHSAGAPRVIGSTDDPSPVVRGARGIALDHFNGRPLARATVTLETIQPGGVRQTSVRTTSSGQFSFFPLPAGAYLVSVSRPNYATAKYGQKFWNAAGTPVLLGADDAPFLEIRLRRLGAVSGAVWDENEIGIAGQEVHAYLLGRPPKRVASARTDDRGVYRIGGLEPGRYIVRSGPMSLDEATGALPTFHREAASVEEARAVDVDLDRETPDVVIRPNFGRLFRLAGSIVPMTPQCVGLAVTLASDMGLATVAGGQFLFDRLAPGPYELMAECADRGVLYSYYQRLNLTRDTEIGGQAVATGAVQLRVDREGKSVGSNPATLLARRKTLAGEGPAIPVRTDTLLAQGRWELMAAGSGGYYPVSISVTGIGNPEGRRADTWQEFLIGRTRPVSIRLSISEGAAAVEGRVTRSLGEPAVGAPVYLEAWDPTARARLAPPRRAIADPQGRYRFPDLPPGSYRIVSSFDFEDPDEETMEFVRAPVVTAGASETVKQDLGLYAKP